MKAAATLDRLEAEAGALESEPFGIGHIAVGCALSYLDFRLPISHGARAGPGWRRGKPRFGAPVGQGDGDRRWLSRRIHATVH